MMKVLHSLDTFLSVTENWIYPQVTQVPGVSTAVICRQQSNASEFPLEGRPIFLQSLAGSRHAGRVRWVLRGLVRRTRSAEVLAVLRAYFWRPTLLHAHFGTRGWAALGLKKFLGVRLVTTFYGYDAWLLPKSHPVWLRRFADLFREGDAFLVEGPAMRQRLIEIGCPSEKIRIRTLGVDLESIPFRNKEFSVGLKILMVGRFVEKKGLVDGLRACALAASRGANIKVTIIGDAPPDDVAGQKIKSELASLAAGPELSGRVQSNGFLPLEETRASLQGHNVLICPSKHSQDGDAEGGYPVVLTEAMAAGLVCIGSRHCDIPEVIIDGNTGRLFDEGDVAKMADILCSLGGEPGKIAEMTKAGRTHIEQNYSLVAQLKKLEENYLAILSDKPSQRDAGVSRSH
jgi:colanic acid/amylovoran biosynthesis glycosyltransferase